MKRQGIYIWMVGISLLLVLLMAIQFVWLRDASIAEKRELLLHTKRALEKTDKDLQNGIYCFEAYNRTYFSGHEGFYMIRQKWDSSGFTGTPDTLTMYFASDRFPSDTNVYTGNSIRDPYPVTAEMQLRFRIDFDSSANTQKGSDTIYQMLAGKSFQDIISNNKPIDSILDMKLVDSVLKRNLLLENIKDDYGFGFISLKEHSIGYSKRINDTSSLKATPYTIAFFSDNKFIKPFRLGLMFNNKPIFYLGNRWLLLSIVIVLSLTLSFYAFIRLYMRQTRLAEMKSDFINNLTHEFNTPMANISLAIETLTEQGQISNPKVNKILNIISTESQRLRDNIERALQVAIMEKGEIQLHKKEFNIYVMIDTVISAYQLQCEQLGGEILFAGARSLIAYGDEAHLRNCIFNLIDNALKYRRTIPLIKISVSGMENSINITVADNGKGMSIETVKHVFEKFYRAHEGNIHNTKGFGLGLSYVKGIVEAHEGTITVSSKIDVGTTFIINLPQKRANGK